MKVEFLDIILFVLFFQLITLSPFLLFQRTNRGISNKILGFFLLAKALCITNFLSFRLWDFTFENFPHSFYFGSSFTILWGPLLYLYIISITDKTFKLKKTDIVHLVPFLIHFTYLFFNFHMYGAETKREILTGGSTFTGNYWIMYFRFLHIYTLIYLALAFWRVFNFRKEIRNAYSSIETINLSWLNFVLIGFSVKWVCDVWFYFSDRESFSATLALVTSRLALFIFINFMIYKGLKQPAIFLGEYYTPGNRKQSLSESTKEIYLKKLLRVMETQKPYLDPDLTLEELAKISSIPQRSLSVVLNECLNKNFYDFVNGYRVKESERILSEDSLRFKTVLEVLFEVGFNSKSSFNSAFKKHTGMTPTQYKKLQTT